MYTPAALVLLDDVKSDEKKIIPFIIWIKNSNTLDITIAMRTIQIILQ
jgi:hypothetical protein